MIDARSLALAQAVAAKLRADPRRVIDKARENLERWRARMGELPPALAEWDRILRGSTPDELIGILTADTEEGRRLRQSSPFPGVLSPEERREIFDRYEES